MKRIASKTTVRLSDIRESIFVRISLNPDHVEHLKELRETGVNLPPLRISDTNELIDGRHRKAAYTELGLETIECEVVHYDSKSEMILDALKSNMGGSLPPSRDDINFTMQALLVSGESRRSIIERMSLVIGLPAKLIRKHLDDIQSKLAKQRLAKAVHAVSLEGKTVYEAADEHSVSIELLKATLSGESLESKSSSNVGHTRAWLTNGATKLNMSFGQTLSYVLRDLKDGVISESDAQEILRHYDKLIGKFVRVRDEWHKRFENHIGIKVGVAEKAKTKVARRKRKKGASALERMGLQGERRVK